MLNCACGQSRINAWAYLGLSPGPHAEGGPPVMPGNIVTAFYNESTVPVASPVREGSANCSQIRKRKNDKNKVESQTNLLKKILNLTAGRRQA